MWQYYIIWFEKYHVIKILTENRNRTIYLTKHMKLNCYRIIKQIKKNPIMQQSFKNEVTCLKNLRHQNIPIIYDIEEDEKYYYLIEEYVEGESLGAYRLNHGFIEESKILDFTIQLCDVIEALHSNKESILYLDLKPNNIIICREVLKLIDFGTAILEREADLRFISFGTKGYAAPEQYGLQNIDKRCDIYGIGSVLFFLMTGFSFLDEKESLKYMQQNKLYSASLKQVLYRCLQLNPSKRFSSVTTLKKQLYKLKRKQKVKLPITPIKIIIAGAERRMGVTHFGIMLTVYLNQYVGKTLYIETGNEQTVRAIKEQYGEQKYFHAVSGEATELIQKYKGYSFYICDYGMWTEDKERIWKYDSLFFLLGIQAWELQVSWELILHFKRKAFYFVPTWEDRELKKCSKYLQEVDLTQIPHQTNPFRVQKGQKKFMKECMNNIPCFIGQERKNWFRRRLHW